MKTTKKGLAMGLSLAMGITGAVAPQRVEAKDVKGAKVAFISLQTSLTSLYISVQK